MDFCIDHNAHREHFERLDTRVGDLETDNKELSRFTERITVLIDKYDEKLDDHDTRIAALESKPAKRWESIVDKALMLAVGSIFGVLLSHFGL